MDPPRRVVGIKKDPKNKFGLVKRKEKEQSKCQRCGAFFSYFVSEDGFLLNALLALIHFISILVVPFLTPIISFLPIQQMTTLQGDVFGRAVLFHDFYAANRLDPWWDITPGLNIVAYIHIPVLIYLVFAYIEVFSFYMTGYDNQGKFPVTYTYLKRFVMISYYIFLGFFLYLFSAMFFFVCVWCLLSAVINPSVFLPYTTAALVILATVSSKILMYRNMKQNLTKNIEIIIK